MSLGNTAESDILLLLFNNTNWALMGDAAGLIGSTVPGSFFVSLATGDPGEGGTQLTTEAAYTGYGRVPVARSGAGWTKSGSAPTQVANTAAVTFGQSSSGPEIETYFVVGRDTAGAGEILWSGILTASLTVNNLVTPSFAIGALICTAD